MNSTDKKKRVHYAVKFTCFQVNVVIIYRKIINNRPFSFRFISTNLSSRLYRTQDNPTLLFIRDNSSDSQLFCLFST